MITRRKPRLDYLVYSETGKKLYKGKSETKMDNLEVKESKLVGDIKYSLDLFSLKDLESQDEISEGMAVITELGKVFRHLHVELKS